MTTSDPTRLEILLGWLITLAISGIIVWIFTSVRCNNTVSNADSRYDLPSGTGTIERWEDHEAQVVCFIYSRRRAQEGGIFCLPLDETALDR